MRSGDDDVNTPLSSFHLPALEFVLDFIEEGIVVIDDQGLVLFANRAAAAALERGVDELIGTYVEVPLLAADPRESTLRHLGGNDHTTLACAIDTQWDGRPARLVCLTAATTA